jgi:hypothetical protein
VSPRTREEKVGQLIALPGIEWFTGLLGSLRELTATARRAAGQKRKRVDAKRPSNDHHHHNATEAKPTTSTRSTP